MMISKYAGKLFAKKSLLAILKPILCLEYTLHLRGE